MIVQKTHARHILIKTSEIASETDAKNRMIQLKERIDNGANFTELARLYSEDGSASKAATSAGFLPVKPYPNSNVPWMASNRGKPAYPSSRLSVGT